MWSSQVLSYRVRGALMAAVHSGSNNIEGFPAIVAAGGDADRLAKPAVQGAVDAREEACRQALVVLQHDELVREASEFRSHGPAHTSFTNVVQQIGRASCRERVWQYG